MGNDSYWFQTFCNQKIDYTGSNADKIDIIDIAHALSMKCRYNGHTREFYCPTQEQRVLKSDLTWVAVGDIDVGDCLVGFDEYPFFSGSGNKKRRKIRPTFVTHKQNPKRKIIRLEMSDGSTVRASAEHPWLVATKQSHNQTWLTSQKIKDDIERGRKRYLHKFLEPWGCWGGRVGGWLSGFWDGEGNISIKNRKGTQCAVGQKQGVVLDKLVRIFNNFGVQYRMAPKGTSGVCYVQLKGGWKKIFEFIGAVQPIRLIKKIKSIMEADDFKKELRSGKDVLQIIKAYDEGEEYVGGIATSTHTYFCEGFGAHNSVAQHCIEVSRIIPEEIRIHGLLHDALEAYMSDVITPMKRYLNDENGGAITKLEDKIYKEIYEAFNLELDDESEMIVKWADKVLLVSEAQRFFDYMVDGWGWKYIEPHEVIKIEKILTPAEAKSLYIEKFWEYTK